MNINIDTSKIDLIHNPDILALVLKSLPKAHIVHVEFFDDDDGKGAYVGINVGVKLDPNEEEHLVSITWNPNTDEVSLERI